ncbi:hypothetical protein FACS189444_0140 [Spirochaetia bacterium]|nr:hypothetical protein FACS189444_0140 [Spirochaetia bacterium]
MDKLLKEERFGFVSNENKQFISEFTKEMDLFGYDFGGEIGNGFCWGNYMIIYSKKDVKNKKVIARIYIRDKGVIIWGGKEYNYNNSIVLRLFFTNIEKHIKYIENAPLHIKKAFIDENGKCHHDRENCRMTKSYIIDGKKIEKCGGSVFEYYDPKAEHIKDYMDILKEFYGKKSSEV